MKKKYLILLSVVVIGIAAAVMASIWGHRNTHGNTIPKDARAIAMFDLRKLATEADLSLQEQQQFVNRLLQMEVDLRELGLDLRQPIYGFATQEGNFGAVSAVSDKDNLETLLTRLHERGSVSELTHQRGYAWATVAQQWLLCIDNSKVMLMGPAVGSAQDQLRSQMVRLMEQDYDDSGMQLPVFSKLTEQDEPLTVIADAQLIPADWRDELCKALNVEQLNDVQLLLGIDADENRVDIDADLITERPDVKERLQRLDDLLRPIEGSLIERAHSSGLLWMACNMEGTKLVELLRQYPDVRTALLGLNMMVDADQMLMAINGDVTLELTDLAFLLGWSQQPSVRLMAELKNMDFLEQRDYWLQSAAKQSAYGLTAEGEGFCLTSNGMTAWFGASDDVLYAASTHDLGTVERALEVNRFLEAERDDICDTRLFVTLDMRPLAAVGRLFGGDNLLGKLRLFQRMNIEMKEPGSFEMTLLAPEGKNLAKSLLLK